MISINNTKAIGVEVVHKDPSIGNGTVVGINNGYIEIEFMDPNGVKVLRKFQFPEIFIDKRKLLTTNSKTLKNMVEEKLSINKCSKCGEYIVANNVLKSRKLCDCCKSKLLKCVICKTAYFEDEHDSSMLEDNLKLLICKDCCLKNYTICSICKQRVHNDAIIQSSYFKEPVCETCAENHFDTCFSCGEYVPEALLIEFNSYISLCPKCNEKVKKCTVCGNNFLADNTDKNCKVCDTCVREQEYCYFLQDLEIYNMDVVEISFREFRKSRTLNLMSRLRKSYAKNADGSYDADKKPFDILIIRDSSGKYVIVWDMPEQYRALSERSCTLTEFKHSNSNKLHFQKDLVVKTLNTSEKFHGWKKPYRIRAQTLSDMDYGNRWCGDYVEEGNQYGDTSNFYILGIIK